MHEDVSAGVVLRGRLAVLAGELEVLAHRAAGVGGDVLERRRVGGAGRDDDRVLHRAVVLERLDDLRDGRALLPDRDVDADDALPLLVDDRVDGDRGLAGLAVADDQLALAAADRDHRVDRLESRLHRLLDGLPVDDARRDPLDRVELRRLDRALAVERLAERVDDAADDGRADRDGDDPLRPADLVPLADLRRVAHEDAADVVLLEVQGEAEDVVRELQELAGHDLVEAVDAGDAVADGEDGPDLGGVDAAVEPGELRLDELRDFACADIGHCGVSFLVLWWITRPRRRPPGPFAPA